MALQPRGRGGSVAGVRTLAVTVSPLLRELVTSVLQPHLLLDVIAVLETRERLAECLQELAPDLVLLGLSGGETDASACALLGVLPSAKILALAPNGEHAWLYEMREHCTALPDLSPPALIGLLTARFATIARQG